MLLSKMTPRHPFFLSLLLMAVASISCGPISVPAKITMIDRREARASFLETMYDYCVSQKIETSPLLIKNPLFCKNVISIYSDGTFVGMKQLEEASYSWDIHTARATASIFLFELPNQHNATIVYLEGKNPTASIHMNSVTKKYTVNLTETAFCAGQNDVSDSTTSLWFNAKHCLGDLEYVTRFRFRKLQDAERFASVFVSAFPNIRVKQ